MKVVFPFHTDIKKLKFGNAPVEEFIEGGIHEDKLEDKRIFYVVQPNCLKETGYRKHFKIGMSNSPKMRLTDYYNHYGKHNSNNKCSGVKVKLILSTNKDDDKDADLTTPNYSVSKVEKKLKDYFKETGKVDRGTEWLLLGADTLRNNIQKALKGSMTDTITHSSHATRSRMSLRPK